MTLGKPGDWTEADELELGRSLLDDISGRIDRGEDVPDELFGAAEGFLETAAVMAHQSDSEAQEAWFHAYSKFDYGLKRATLSADLKARGVWERGGASLVRLARKDPVAADLAGMFLSEEAGYDFEPSDSMRARAFSLTPESIRNYWILNAAPRVDQDGRPVIEDSDGMVWDLSEALSEFQRPEVRHALAQSRQGVVPGPDALSNTLGAMGTAQMVLQGVSKAKVALGREQTANLRTAQPGLVLPWTLPIEGFDEKIKDPLWTRALIQTMEEMEKAGELDPSALETLTRVASGFADFVLFSKGLSASSKALGSFAVSKGVSGASMRGKLAARLAAGRSDLVFPLNTHVGRLAADFMGYDVATRVFNDTTTVTEDMWTGLKSAAVFGIAGNVARLTRAPVSKLAEKALKVEKAVPASLDTMENLHKQVMKSNEATLLGALKKIEARGVTRDMAKRTIDSMLTGMYVHAFGEVQEEGGFGSFWQSLLSPNALATGMGFALGTALQAGPAVRRKMNDLFRSPAGRQMMRSVAERLASPRASEDVRQVWDKFDLYRKTAPNVFKGLIKTNQSARETMAARESNLQAIRTLMGWHPERGEPSQDQHRPRSIPYNPDSTARERFETSITIGQGALAGIKAQQPKYLLGEIEKQTLQDIGFSDHKHALNAVNKYLREKEGDEAEQFKRLSDVPRPIWMRMLDHYDAEARAAAAVPKQSELPVMEGEGTDLVGIAAMRAKSERVPVTPEAPGGLDFTAKGGGTHSPISLKQAADLYQRAQHIPENAGKAPLIVVVETKVKGEKGRPSLKTAIERVASGKKTVDWLAEKFPEGREAIEAGRTLVEVAIAVRAAWQKANTDRLLKSSSARRQPKTLQDFVAMNGGIVYSEDLKSLTRRDNPRKDGRTVVYSAKSGKGMKLDDMAERAWEEGFFPGERPDINEFVNALVENRYHPDDARLTKEHEAHVARVETEGAAQWRRGIESGEAPLPLDPAERSKFIQDTFSGDPNYAGMKPDEIEAQVMDLRRQASEGDPGAAFASRPATIKERTEAYATRSQRLADDLKAMGVVGEEATRSSPEVTEAVLRLADGDTMLLEGRASKEEMQQHVAAAREMIADVRGAISSIYETGTPERAAVDILFDALDSMRLTRDPKPETVEFFKKHGALDEFGIIKQAALDQMKRDLVERMWEQVRGHEELGDFQMFSGLPVAFAGHKFSSIEPRISWNKIYANPTFQRFMQRPWVRKLFRGATEAGSWPGINIFSAGPLSRPQSEATQGAVRRGMFTIARKASEMRHLEMRAAAIAKAMSAPFQGRRMPLEHSEFFVRGVESGSFQDARSPADFEARMAGTGYLFRVYQDYTELMATITDLARPWLSKEQIAARGGKYLMTRFVREDVASVSGAVASGEVPVSDIGRAMLREDGAPDIVGSAMRIFDAPYLVTKSVESWSTLLRASNAWFEPIHGSSFVSANELRKMHPLDAEDYALAGVRIKPGKGQSLLSAMEDLANTGRYETDTLLTSFRLQTLQESMAKEGAPPTPGKMAYSAELTQMIQTWLGEGPDGPVYLPRSLQQEIGLLTEEAFTSPGGSALKEIGRTVDLAGSFMKRGLTALRPAAMSLDYLSSAMNNHVGRAVPLTDFIGGHFGVKSTDTYQGLRAWELYSRWVKDGAPRSPSGLEPADGWSVAEWAHLQRAKRFLDTAGASSSVYAVIGPEIASATGISSESPAQLRAALESQLEEHASRAGITLSQRDRLAARIAQIAKSSAHGLEHVDESIARLMDEPDPAAHARAMQQYGAMRHLLEIFTFKYPAFLRMSREHPDVPGTKVMQAALERTGNVGDTTSASRRWLSMHTPYGNVAWQKAQGQWKVPGTKFGIGKAWPRMLIATLLRNRFYSYPQTMAPQMLQWHITNPIGVAFAAAVTYGVKSGIWALMGDEERQRMEEEMAASRQGAVSWMAMHESEREAYERALNGSRVGFVGGGMRLPEKAVSEARALWANVAGGGDPWAIPMPKHGGEARSASLSELSPTGFLMGRARTQASLVSNVLGAGEGKAREGLQGVSRILGLTAQAVFGTAAGVLTADDPLIQALGGKGSVTEALASKTFSTLGTAGLLYPRLGMFTPEGIFIGENAVLNGKSWREALRGVDRFYNSQDASGALAASALRVMWPSRAMYARPPLGASEDAWTALLSEVYGPGFQASSEQGRDKTRAGRWGMMQMAVMLGDLYEQHFDKAGDPAEAEVTLSERVVGATLELMQHSVPAPGGGFDLEPGYEPKGILMRSVADLPETVRPHAVEFLRRWLTTDTFTQDGLSWLFMAGEGREMPKGLFRAGMMNALSDPSGTSLLAWWAEQIKDNDQAVMGHLAPLINDVQMPSKGSAAHKTWANILVQYARAGVRLPPLPAEGRATVDEILGAKGAPRALQGGQAFENVLQMRQPSEAESIFMPR